MSRQPWATGLALWYALCCKQQVTCVCVIVCECVSVYECVSRPVVSL